MRKIKFRGRDFAGLWHIGDLIHNDDDLLIRNGCLSTYIENETAGQFTGLLDKNGKEIYEGDIVDAWSAGGHLPNGIIKWGEGIAGFFIMPPKCNAVWHLVGNDENKETLEVLGNIHDNPELLKGGIYEGN